MLMNKMSKFTKLSLLTLVSFFKSLYLLYFSFMNQIPLKYKQMQMRPADARNVPVSGTLSDSLFIFSVFENKKH